MGSVDNRTAQAEGDDGIGRVPTTEEPAGRGCSAPMGSGTELVAWSKKSKSATTDGVDDLGEGGLVKDDVMRYYDSIARKIKTLVPFVVIRIPQKYIES